MAIKHWFNNWEWLKNSADNEWSYTRVVGAISTLIIQPAILTYVYLNKDIKEVTNLWQWAVIAIPTLLTITLFGMEVIKENKAISFKIGDKVYGFSKNDDKNDGGK
jgi:hypothetical protein